MRHLAVFFLALAIGTFSSANAHAYCVEIAFYDDNGNLIVSEGLIVGMMVGEAPIYNSPNIPAHREAKAARKVACPREFVDEVRNLFNRSCTSEQAREQAVMSNRTSAEIVMKRCGELAAALKSSD